MSFNPVLQSIQTSGTVPVFNPAPVAASPEVVAAEVEDTGDELADALVAESTNEEEATEEEESYVDWSAVSVEDRKNYFPDHLAINLASRMIKGTCKGKPCTLREAYHATTVFVPKLDMESDFGKRVAQGLWSQFAKSQIQKFENDAWQGWGSAPDTYGIPYENDTKLDAKVREQNVWEFMTECVIPVALTESAVLAALYPVTEEDWKAWTLAKSGGWWDIFKVTMVALGKDPKQLDELAPQYRNILAKVHSPLQTKPETLASVTMRLQSMRESTRPEIRAEWERCEGERFYAYHMAKINVTPDTASELDM